MKVFVSVDMEGLAYVNNWDEVNRSKPDYELFAKEMTKEVVAVVDAFNEKYDNAEIYVKDAHATARNIIPTELPDNVRLIRGWAEKPESMVEYIDNTFDCAVFVGYHIGRHSNQNPLSHTISSKNIAWIKINGEYASEFDIYGLTCSYYNVPVIFVSGDQALSEYITEKYPQIATLSTVKGIGDSTISLLSSNQVSKKIKEGVQFMLGKRVAKMKMPNKVRMEIRYNEHKNAYAMSFYPGVEVVDDFTIAYTSKDYYDVLRFKYFALKM